jgi:hypothetical protein
MGILIDTAALPPAERFDRWGEELAGHFFPVGVRRPDTSPFTGRLEHYVLGPLMVHVAKAGACTPADRGGALHLHPLSPQAVRG